MLSIDDAGDIVGKITMETTDCEGQMSIQKGPEELQVMDGACIRLWTTAGTLIAFCAAKRWQAGYRPKT